MKLPPGYVEGKGVVKPTAYGGYGERMLKSLGWSKGKGLGKEGQGMKEAIEVKQKDDTIGVRVWCGELSIAILYHFWFDSDC